MENDICFKCCELIKYVRKICRKEVKCVECDSIIYYLVLYVLFQFIWIYKMVEVYGGEQRREIGIIVDLKCIQICRDVYCISKLCFKIVLVKVYCEELLENVKKLYVIIDD